MRRVATLILIVLAACAAPAAPVPDTGATLTGMARVHDGDTLTIGGVPVRLKGISAPELAEAGGVEAREALRRLVAGQVVTCALTGERTYHRAVGYCAVGALDLQAELVRAGLVMACPRFDPRYLPLEADPRAAHVGVWGNGYALPGYCEPRPRAAGAR